MKSYFPTMAPLYNWVLDYSFTYILMWTLSFGLIHIF